jgi:hypothetical protein
MSNHRAAAGWPTLVATGLIVVVGSLSLLSVALSQAMGATPDGPVFTVAGLHSALQHHPHTWTGRVVRVRGIAMGCRGRVGRGHECTTWFPVLVDSSDAGAALPLWWDRANELLTLWRRVPALGGLLPPVQVLRWGEDATYWVRLQALPPGYADPTTVPSEAILLDAAPDTSLHDDG